jgi:hypothetical protein
MCRFHHGLVLLVGLAAAAPSCTSFVRSMPHCRLGICILPPGSFRCA